MASEVTPLQCVRDPEFEGEQRPAATAADTDIRMSTPASDCQREFGGVNSCHRGGPAVPAQRRRRLRQQ